VSTYMLDCSILMIFGADIKKPPTEVEGF